MMIMLQNMVELQFMDSAVTGWARGKKLGREAKRKVSRIGIFMYIYL